MKLRAEIDFTYDARGRMLLSAEPCVNARRPAPRFTVGRATDGHIARFSATLADVSARQLQLLIDQLEPAESMRFPEATLGMLREMLGVPESAGGPAYRFPEEIRL